MAQELRAHAAVNPLTQGLTDMAQSWGRLAAELVPQVPELPGLIQQSVASLDGQAITEERLEAAARDIASHVEEAGYSAEAAQLLRRMGRAMYELLLVLATQEELRAMGMLLAVAPNPAAEAPRPKPPAPAPPHPAIPTSGPGVVPAPSPAPPTVPQPQATSRPTAPSTGKAAPAPPRPAPAPQTGASAAQPPQQPLASPPGPARPDSVPGPRAGTPPASPAAPGQPVRAAQVPGSMRPVALPPTPPPAAQRLPGMPSATADPVSSAVSHGASAAPPPPVVGGYRPTSPSAAEPVPPPTALRTTEVGTTPAADPSTALRPPPTAPAAVDPAPPSLAPSPTGPPSSSSAIPFPAPPEAAGPAKPSEGAAGGRPLPGVHEVPEADLWGFDPSEREPEPTVEVSPAGPALEVASTPVEPQPPPAVGLPTPGPGVWTVRLSPRRAQARDRKLEARRHELKPLVEEIVKQVHEQRRAVSDRGTARQAVRASAEAVPPADLALAAAQLDDLLQAGQHERATALALRVTEAFPGEASAELACRAGEACRAVKQDDLAVLNLTTAVLAAPPFEQACWQLAGMALERKDPQLAPIWLEFVARLLRVRGADEDAVVVYRQLVNLCPRRQDVREILSSASLTGSLPD